MDINLDAIFTFLFVVAIILSQVGGAILKRLKSQRRGQDEPGGKTEDRRPGIIQSLVTHIKEEIEKAQQAAQPPPGQPTGWEAFKTSSDIAKDTRVEDASAARSAYRQTTETITDDYQEDLSDDLSIDEDILENEQLLKGVPDDLNPPTPPTPPATPPSRSGRYATNRVRELRRAVIWSEILAPPVALRNEDQP